MRLTKAYEAEIGYVAEVSQQTVIDCFCYIYEHHDQFAKKLNLVILCGLLVCSWHISSDVGQRSVADSVARVAETPR